ncbi:LysM peptidoglycan-binding domain-containing protein [Brachybacterium phenoliresistens]|uniref:LysM peptidoglycan-binding domain-containing protein n=1 Tax=Brachybacterium phenoliresistens TaxID=396014 RepID=UPI0004AE7212|nr:LysM domain-containing protein [Brachybacterium phenoliresistens]
MTSAAPPRRAARPSSPGIGPTGGAYALLSVLAAAAGAAALLCARSFGPAALAGAGTQAMTASLLALVGLAATAFCGYLTLIWALAALARGRHGRLSGRASLQVLRLLAPALARRVALGAATATAVGSLALGPALAMDPSSWEDPPSTPSAPSATAQTVGTAASAPAMSEPLLEAAHPSHMVRAGAAAELAPVPADGEAVPADGEAVPADGESVPRDRRDDAASSSSEVAADPDETPPGLGWVAPAPEPASPAPQQRTVTVHPGDSLWSLTDDLLGPEDEPAAEIAAAWPELYRANSATIGSDPDLIHPGQVLVIPAGIGEGPGTPDQPAPSTQDTRDQEVS